MKSFSLFLLHLVLFFVNSSFGHQVSDELQQSNRIIRPSSFSSPSTVHSSQDSRVLIDNSLRQRRLPGAAYGEYDFGNMDSAEAGFIAGILFLVVMICLLLCCCCGRCSLWDIVALACLWELCCDRDGAAGDFAML
jgi:hypothetical protein